MAKKFFKKTLIKSKVFGSDGKAIAFTQLREGYGVLETDEGSPVAVFLADCVTKHIGGITELTEAQYNEIKKKLAIDPTNPVDKKSKVALQLVERNMLKKAMPTAAIKASNPSPPPSEPRPERAHVLAAAERVSARSATTGKGDALAVAAEGSSKPVPELVDYFKPKTGSPEAPKPAE